MVNIQSELMELRKQTDSATHLRLPLQSRSFGVLKPEWDPVLQDLASLMWLFIYTDTHHLIDTTWQNLESRSNSYSKEHKRTTFTVECSPSFPTPRTLCTSVPTLDVRTWLRRLWADIRVAHVAKALEASVVVFLARLVVAPTPGFLGKKWYMESWSDPKKTQRLYVRCIEDLSQFWKTHSGSPVPLASQKQFWKCSVKRIPCSSL